MDITLSSVFALCLGGLYFWKNRRDEKRAIAARKQIKNDNILYQHIKTGLREYNWKEDNEEDFFDKVWDAKDKDVLLENAHMIVHKVEHIAEFRLGFFFKDIKQYGLYGNFEGWERYYRTDASFNKEEALYYDSDNDEEGEE